MSTPTAWRVQAATILLGTGHEAATGVLQWVGTATGNLTGAFGAVREEP